MSEIIDTTIRLNSEKIILCDRCLGRLFGKLGHNLDNLTRGRLISFLIHLRDSFNEIEEFYEDDGSMFKELRCMINTFDFQPKYNIPIIRVLNQTAQTTDERDVISFEEQKTGQDQSQFKEQIIKIFGSNKLEKITRELTTDYYENTHDDCHICRGLFDEFPHFAKLVVDAVSKYEFNNFLIGCKIDRDIVTSEEEVWSKFGLKHPEPIKSEFNRELGKLVQPMIDKEVDFGNPDMTIIVDSRYDDISLQIASLFIYGRYKKFVRDLPQTKWPCKRCWGKGCEKCKGTGKIYLSSVEEEIAREVMDATLGSAHYLHGMGREDIGVRMLGNGRPFILEITNPVKRFIDLSNLENEINNYTKDKVEVLGLKFTDHNTVRALKSAKPDKTYSVKVSFEKKVNKGKLKKVINTLSGQIIEQRTPIRVSHRRADLVRSRTIRDMKLVDIPQKGEFAEIIITGESGLYVKELITGDSGRTRPSLTGLLGTECTVQELDVIKINDDDLDLNG